MSADLKHADLKRLGTPPAARGFKADATACGKLKASKPVGIKGQWSACDVYCGHGRQTRLHEIVSCSKATHYTPYMMTLREHKTCYAGGNCPPGKKLNEVNPDVAVPRP